ncbi:hypothetical protein LSO9J_30005 [Candidatus Liberibacter solanacearum]
MEKIKESRKRKEELLLKYKKEFYNNEFVPRLRKRASKEWKIEKRQQSLL